MLQRAFRPLGTLTSYVLLIGFSLAAVQNAAAQVGGPTVGAQGGRFGVGFTSSWPAYGLSGTVQLSDALTAEAVLGFFGTVSEFGGRAWYRFNRNENYDIYGYGAAGVYHYGYHVLGTSYSENVLGLGGGGGIETGLQNLLKDEKFPPIFVNAEVGLAFASFNNYSSFSTFVFGAGIHYRFGGRS